jgi:cytochrome oxidase Cu insertion factor (SCO1/SenC/PrrC family)
MSGMRFVRRLAWLGVVVAALVLAARLLYRPPSGYRGTPLDGRPAPDFRLTDQWGRSVRLSALRGSVVVLVFVNSRGTLESGLTALLVRLTQADLGPAADRVRWIAVNVNPLHTSPADVLAWSRGHGMVRRWLFLTGSAARLRRVWRAYSVGVTVTTDGIVHSQPVYVIDPRGRERWLFEFQDTASLTADARLLADTVAFFLP